MKRQKRAPRWGFFCGRNIVNYSRFYVLVKFGRAIAIAKSTF